MWLKIKTLIKRALAALGLYHPSLGVKIHSPEKAAMLLAHKTPAISTFVETGTLYGDMIERLASHFKQVYSIELDPELHARAEARFKEKENIQVIQGDSAEKMAEVLERLHEPALFWLDAHAPGAITLFGPDAAPTGKELEAILAHPTKGHVILIDDARHFDLRSIARVKELARAGGYRFTIKEGLFVLN